MIIRKIKQIIGGILKAIYSLLCVFNLQFALLVALIGIVFRFTGLFDKHNSLLIVFFVAFIFALFLAFCLTMRKLLGIGKNKEKDRKIKIIKAEPEKEQPYQQQGVKPTNIDKPKEEQVSSSPIYYRVKQNPNYLMAEFEDRYELYLQSSNGLQKIRTDYKD